MHLLASLPYLISLMHVHGLFKSGWVCMHGCDRFPRYPDIAGTR